MFFFIFKMPTLLALDVSPFLDISMKILIFKFQRDVRKTTSVTPKKGLCSGLSPLFYL